MYIVEPDLSGLLWRVYWAIVLVLGLAWLMSRSRMIPYSWSVLHTLVLIGAGFLLKTVVLQPALGGLILFLVVGLYWWFVPRLHRRTRESPDKQSA